MRGAGARGWTEEGSALPSVRTGVGGQAARLVPLRPWDSSTPPTSTRAAATSTVGAVRATRSCRDLRFPSFMDAIRFIDRVAVVAEDADHHPELSNVYWNVGIRLTTHDAGGITERDVELARAIDGVVEAAS
jgi:4a-hydroxytetrahydrobiopterin dehydratase